ncbi:hypothetical protein ACFL39_00590 [Gemmatimonadota bacterium]
MSSSIFLRIIDIGPEDKGSTLKKYVAQCRSVFGEKDVKKGLFLVDPLDFNAIPGSPFAYWVDEDIRRIFRDYPPLEGNVGTVKVGLQTSDDFRFVRAWWEVDPSRLGYSAEDTDIGRGWIHFAKAGSFSPYYAGVHLVVNWFDSGAEIKNFNGADGKLASRPQNEDYYFRSGLTYSRRGTNRLGAGVLPSGCAFSDTGCAIIADNDPLQLLGFLNSSIGEYLLRVSMGRAISRRAYEVGILQSIPVPSELAGQCVSPTVRSLFDLARRQLATEETSSSCGIPFQIESFPALDKVEEESILTLELDSEIKKILRISPETGEIIREEVYEGTMLPLAEAVRIRGSRDVILFHDESFIMWLLGVVFGRWDVRMTQDQGLLPDLQGPFERLPQVAPAGLVGPNGLPATPDSIVSEAWLRARPDVITLPEQGSFEGPATITSDDYPIDVAWNGILVDDPDHPRDIVRKVREVLQYIFGDRADEIEQEALEILRGDGKSPTNLRDWFRNQRATAMGKNFFEYHIDRYSKSRRKAPIYWRLCSHPSKGQGRYAVWLYYHQLNDDTLWTVLNDYLGPKRVQEQQEADNLRAELGSLEGRERAQTEKDLEEKQELLDELQWMDEELRKVLARQGGYAPDRDDGVVINMAPLHRLVPWDEPAKIWEKLEAGEYDWAKLAKRYWPERVNAKCEKDKSLAITHAIMSDTD